MLFRSRRVQAVDGVGGERDGRVEAEAVGSADDVVVDRFGHGDDRDPALAELVADRERAVAADRHERVEAHAVKHLDDALAVGAGAI